MPSSAAPVDDTWLKTTLYAPSPCARRLSPPFRTRRLRTITSWPLTSTSGALGSMPLPINVAPLPSTVTNAPLRYGSRLVTTIGPATSKLTIVPPLRASANAARTAASVGSVTRIVRPPAPPAVVAPKPSSAPSSSAPTGGAGADGGSTTIVLLAVARWDASATPTTATYVPGVVYTCGRGVGALFGTGAVVASSPRCAGAAVARVAVATVSAASAATRTRRRAEY